MSSTPTDAAADKAVSDEAYLPIEEAAKRLDLPLGVLIGRVEAGDVPARRSEGPDGAEYSVRLSDLGVRAEPEQAEASAAPEASAELVGTMPKSWPDKVVPPPSEELAAMSAPGPRDADSRPSRSNGREAREGRPEGAGRAAPAPPAGAPGGQQRYALVNGSPRSEVANMALDPRELVAGLLDRWERTLEQRIYAEQRQRFETELNARQNLLKQLQLELQAARAEHAAAQADKDRRLAERERELADLERDLAAAREAGPRKRGWFRWG